ncbi:MAG: pGP6-D family virulence protein [Timaviella obliquedivisa GSE-PSE-MK23-08B]|nr:pGP6-D family virulence protein [Timaviella obliquedivisa GSE-PSE-MK23-08B]
MAHSSRYPQGGAVIETQDAQEFDYGALDEKTRKWLDRVEIEITVLLLQVEDLGNRYVSQVIQVGERLVNVRDRLRYVRPGGFDGWCALKGWCRAQAYNYISAYERFGKCPIVGHFDIAPSALWMLSAATVPEEVRDQALALAREGRAIDRATAKTLIYKTKPVSQERLEIGAEINIAAGEFQGQAATVLEVKKNHVVVELADSQRKLPMLYSEVFVQPEKPPTLEKPAPKEMTKEVGCYADTSRVAVCESKLAIVQERCKRLEGELSELKQKCFQTETGLRDKTQYSDALCRFIESILTMLPTELQAKGKLLLENA